jgi:hypothetical protein
MATPERKSEVIYRSGTNEGLGAGWDVMQVVYRHDDDGQVRRCPTSAAVSRCGCLIVIA